MKKLRTKRTLALLLSVLLILPAASSTLALDIAGVPVIANGFASGNGTEEEPYIISNHGEFMYFAESVNTGTSYAGMYIILTCNIAFNDTTDWELWGGNDDMGNPIAPVNTWAPIGYSIIDWETWESWEYPFSGSFNGNGNTIEGIYYNATDDSGIYAGLFGYCVDANISNVKVAKSYIKGQSYVGGIVGYIYGGEVFGCGNGASVYGTNMDVGGIVGSTFEAAIVSCTNRGTVSGASAEGVDSIAGSGDQITECKNYGNISGKSCVGGIGGLGGNKIGNCVNNGIVSGVRAVGGIAGNIAQYGMGEAEAGLINNCYNTGAVYGLEMFMMQTERVGG